MLTVKDLMANLQVTRRTIATWYARKIIPAPLKIGGVLRWREEDIEAWMQYLLERRDVLDTGGDPNALDGPEPPIYSTGVETCDPRAISARLRERDRREKSKTLAAASQPTKPETMPEMPEPAGDAAVSTEEK